jgi:hypothetical protein
MSAWRALTLVFTPSFYILLSCACLAQFKMIFNVLSTAAYQLQQSPLEAFAPSKSAAHVHNQTETRQYKDLSWDISNPR